MNAFQGPLSKSHETDKMKMEPFVTVYKWVS